MYAQFIPPALQDKAEKCDACKYRELLTTLGDNLGAAIDVYRSELVEAYRLSTPESLQDLKHTMVALQNFEDAINSAESDRCASDSVAFFIYYAIEVFALGPRWMKGVLASDQYVNRAQDGLPLARRNFESLEQAHNNVVNQFPNLASSRQTVEQAWSAMSEELERFWASLEPYYESRRNRVKEIIPARASSE